MVVDRIHYKTNTGGYTSMRRREVEYSHAFDQTAYAQALGEGGAEGGGGGWGGRMIREARCGGMATMTVSAMFSFTDVVVVVLVLVVR